jgi:hypothetical protein
MAFDNSGPHKVGYRKPPVASQFKPGQSGNPRGRPQKRETNAEILNRIVNQKVKVATPDGKKILSKRELFLTQFVAKAINGDPRNSAILMKTLQSDPESKDGQPLIIFMEKGDELL